MRLKTIMAAAAITAVTAFAGSAQAGHKSHSDVSIKGTNGDYYGYVKSADSDCGADRKVKVYKMLGASPSPKTDQMIGSDTTDSSPSNKAMWSIGNSGYKHGYFYAKVKKTTYCSGERSKVISR